VPDRATVTGARSGAHVSAAGGPAKAVVSARKLGCEALQLFVSNPRGWLLPPTDPAGDERFRQLAAEAALYPTFIHAPYLVNFASTSDRFRERSGELVAATLARGDAMGAAGVVVHAGSAMGTGRARGIARVREAVLPLLDGAGDAALLFELTAGGGEAIAARFEQMAELLAVCGDHPRLKVCFDTCHAHAAGYDLSCPAAASAALDELFAVLGERVALVHANDSAAPAGSGRDHHARIGKGEIGMSGFGAILAHPRLADLPVVIETPGSDQERAADVATLKALRPPRSRPR
jgi:deoxyribonuclease-4